MHNENLNILKNISQNTSDMAHSIRDMKEIMKQYVENYLLERNCSD